MDQRLLAAHARVCAYLFLGALAVRFLYLTQYATTPFFWVPALDSLYHDLHAQAIAAGKQPAEAFFRAPLYAYFLGGIYKLFGHSFWAVRTLQALMGAGSCVLLYLLGVRLVPPTAALVGAVAMALYGPLVYFEAELHSPGLEVFLDLLFLLLAVRAADQGSLRDWLLAGLVLGLSAVARPNVLVALPLPLLLLWGTWTDRGGAEGAPASGEVEEPNHDAEIQPRPVSRAGALALFLVGAMLAPGIVTFRNWRVSGDPVFIAAQGGINLYLGNRPQADGFTPSTPKRYAFEGEYEDSVLLYGQRGAEEALGRKLSPSEAQRHWIGETLKWWREDPTSAARLLWKKWVLAWGRREVRNNASFDFIRAEFAPLLWLCPVGFWFAGPFGLLGMALAWRERPRTRSLALFVLLYVLSFTVFFVADRFRLPVVPPLLLFAGYAVVRLTEWVRTGERSRLAPALAALAALAVFVNVEWYRTATPKTWALDHWSAGNRYRQMQRFEEAEAQYRKALQGDPENAEVWLNLGTAQYYSGRLPDAAESFREAMRRDPKNASAHFNLAMCELQLGRREEARGLLETAVELDPSHRGARTELEKLRGGSG